MRVLSTSAALMLVIGALYVAGGHRVWSPAHASVDPVAPAADDPRNKTGDDKVVMLAADWCGYCRRLQDDFTRARVRYTVLDVDTPAGDRAMRALGARGVPVTVIGQDVIRGYDTRALDERLTPLGYRVY